MTHKILIEPEHLIVIRSGRKKHYLCHKCVKMSMSDTVIFYCTTGHFQENEVSAIVTYIDNELPGCNNNHFIFSFELV